MLHRTRLMAVTVCALLITPLVTMADTSLPKDPNNTYGVFDNGLKYIIRPHTNPPERVALFLHVQAGALNETEVQNGLAHFLEHMAFNGSAHFAPGELIPYMNNLGMQFGADSNAHTSFKETVYKLFMPDNKDETVDVGLTVLSDWAHGLLLLEEEINKERGVLLEEARARKGVWDRIFDMWRTQVLAGSRIAVHDIIGDEKQIEKFPQGEFLDYWNTWYRPENMTLIVVGEVEPDIFITKAQPFFGNFKPRSASRKPVGAEIKLVNQARAFVFSDPEQVKGQVEVMTITEKRPPIKTYKQYRFNEVENMGTWMVSRRLEDMINKGAASFRVANVYVNNFFNEAIVATGSTTGEPEDWNKMLDQVIIEINRAIEHGFTQREFELAKKDLLSSAERDVEMEPTQDAKQLMWRISAAIGSDSPLLSAPQHLELIKRILVEVSVSEVHQVFVDNFKRNNYNYVLTMPEKKEGLTLPSKQDVLAAAKAAWARKTKPIREDKDADSLLVRIPEPGKVASQSTDPDLKITTATLSNGVTAHHRFMDYEKDKVIASIVLAGGVIEETAANRGVSQVAALANATSRLTSTQIRDLMTGKKVDVSSNAGLDTVTISIEGSPVDLETGFQLAYTMLTDAKIEQSAFDNWKKGTLQQLEAMKTTPFGQVKFAMDEVFCAGDVRLSTLTEEQIENLNVAKGEKWLKHITASAPIEVTVVGDISLEDAMVLVTRYVGSLPQRSLGYEGLDSLRKLNRGPGPYTKTVKFESVTPKAVAYAGFVGAEERKMADHRKLTMAALIVSDRMIKRIREEERLVYGIGAYHQPARGMPGLGRMMAGAPTDPENAEKLADTILEMFRDFATSGPTAVELDVARKQMANRLETSMKKPQFWFNQINQLAYRKRPLSELKELPEVYQTFSAKQLQNIVKKYMQDDKIIRVVAIPETKSSEVPAESKSAGPAQR